MFWMNNEFGDGFQQPHLCPVITLKPEQNGWHLTNNILTYICLKKLCILKEIMVRCFLMGVILEKSALESMMPQLTD